MDMTRRSFVGAVAATLAIPSIGIAESNDWFEDLRVDRYYTLQGGHYKDTGGWGCPYPAMGNEIVKSMEFWEHCRELEDKLDEVESRGFYLSQSQYFGKSYREYEKIPEKIPLTKRWMTEFYRRHRDDKPEDWKKRYDDYISDLKARGWHLVDGSFCNPEMGDY